MGKNPEALGCFLPSALEAQRVAGREDSSLGGGCPAQVASSRGGTSLVPAPEMPAPKKTPHVLAAETRKQTDKGKQRCLCLSAGGICSLPGYKGWQLQEGFSPGRQLKKQRLRPQPANWCSLSERCFLAVLGFLSLSSSGRRNCTACTYLLCFV